MALNFADSGFLLIVAYATPPSSVPRRLTPTAERQQEAHGRGRVPLAGIFWPYPFLSPLERPSKSLVIGPHHVCDKGLDVLPTLLGLKHERSHRVGGELSAHHPTRGLSFHAPLVAGEECVLCIVHRGTAVVTRLFVLSIKALQVLVETTVTRHRLRQVEGRSQSHRASSPARERDPGLDGVSISQCSLRTISPAISLRALLTVCCT